MEPAAAHRPLRHEAPPPEISHAICCARTGHLHHHLGRALIFIAAVWRSPAQRRQLAGGATRLRVDDRSMTGSRRCRGFRAEAFEDFRRTGARNGWRARLHGDRPASSSGALRRFLPHVEREDQAQACGRGRRAAARVRRGAGEQRLRARLREGGTAESAGLSAGRGRDPGDGQCRNSPCRRTGDAPLLRCSRVRALGGVDVQRYLARVADAMHRTGDERPGRRCRTALTHLRQRRRPGTKVATRRAAQANTAQLDWSIRPRPQRSWTHHAVPAWAARAGRTTTNGDGEDQLLSSPTRREPPTALVAYALRPDRADPPARARGLAAEHRAHRRQPVRRKDAGAAVEEDADGANIRSVAGAHDRSACRR